MDTKSNTWKCVASSNERLSDSIQECHCRMKILALRCDMHYSISEEHVTRSPYHLRTKLPRAEFSRETLLIRLLYEIHVITYYCSFDFFLYRRFWKLWYIFLSTNTYDYVFININTSIFGSYLICHNNK